MKAFSFARAAEPKQVIAALADPGTQIIAGGTELLNWMRLGIAAPERLVDISKLHTLDGITRSERRISIGALTSLNEIGEHADISTYAATLAQACLKAASAQIRNRATIGGNVLQRTRCAYFRSEAPVPWECNKRTPSSGCAAIAGLNERHAIFGWTNDCAAVHPSDPAVALACLDAEIELLGPRGRRSLPFRDFLLTQAEAEKAGSAAQVESRLMRGEMITAFHIMVRPDERSAYLKVRERESFEYAIVSAAAAVKLKADRIVSARIALGSVAQRPWRLLDAEQALAGKRLAREEIAPVIEAAMAEAKTLPHNDYKTTLARNAAIRALLMAGGAA